MVVHASLQTPTCIGLHVSERYIVENCMLHSYSIKCDVKQVSIQQTAKMPWTHTFAQHLRHRSVAGSSVWLLRNSCILWLHPWKHPWTHCMLSGPSTMVAWDSQRQTAAQVHGQWQRRRFWVQTKGDGFGFRPKATVSTKPPPSLASKTTVSCFWILAWLVGQWVIWWACHHQMGFCQACP